MLTHTTAATGDHDSLLKAKIQRILLFTDVDLLD
jgi:hypothetical protein